MRMAFGTKALLACGGAMFLAGYALSGSRDALATVTFIREPNLDRSGDDLRRDVLPADATVEACENSCAATAGCVAYTFVLKSDTVPKPICWLKKVVPVGYPSACCISGIKKP